MAEAETVSRPPETAVGVHAVVSLVLFFAPLVAAARLARPGEPMFGGVAAGLVPLYYVAVFVVMVTPSVRSMQESPDPTTPGVPAVSEDGAVGRLQRRYVTGELSEREFERRLEGLLERSAEDERNDDLTPERLRESVGRADDGRRESDDP